MENLLHLSLHNIPLILFLECLGYAAVEAELRDAASQGDFGLQLERFQQFVVRSLAGNAQEIVFQV